MTLLPLAHDFPLATPPLPRDGLAPLRLSRRPLWTIAADERHAALRDEREQRRRVYPRWIEQGRLSADDAARHVALWDELIADAEGAPPPPAPRWDAKVRELRREIALRRRVYPRRVASGHDETRLARALETIEAVHWHYWIRLDRWDEHPPVPLAAAPALCPHRHDDLGAIGHWPCAWAAAREAARAALRARLDAADAALWRLHDAGDPAVAGLFTPADLARRAELDPDFERKAA